MQVQNKDKMTDQNHKAYVKQSGFQMTIEKPIPK